MSLANMVWRAHHKYASAVFLTACSYGFLYTVVNNSTPLDDAKAWRSGERATQGTKYQMRLASSAGSNN